MNRAELTGILNNSKVKNLKHPVFFVTHAGRVISYNKSAAELIRLYSGALIHSIEDSFDQDKKNNQKIFKNNNSIFINTIFGFEANCTCQMIWFPDFEGEDTRQYAGVLIWESGNHAAIEGRYIHYLKSINKLSGNSNKYKNIHSLSRFFANELYKAEYNFYHVGLFLRDPLFSGSEVILMAAAGESRQFLKKDLSHRYHQSISTGVIGKVITERRSIIVDDTDKIDFYHSTSLFRGKSEIAVPIFLHNEVMGVINIESKELVRFDSSDQAFLEAVADIYAANIYRIETHKEIQKKNSELENYLDQIRKYNEKLERQSKRLRNALEKRIEIQKIVEKQNEKIQNKLEMGAELQKSLLPRSFPDSPELVFHACYYPNSQLGGDLYDVCTLDDNHIGIIIADVSGYGVSAAMIAAMFKAYFNNFSKSLLSTAGIMSRLNRAFYSVLQTGDFISAFYMILDTRNFKAIYTNAGHTFPLLYRASTAQIEELDTSGFFVGLFDRKEYQEQETVIFPGDRLLFYTDGVVESRNHKNQFGIGRLRTVYLNEILNGSEGKEILNKIIDEIQRFTGRSSFEDDVTLLNIERMVL
ncbi:MAG: GAF domain-containing protein [Calditrichaeota bacterium]|nr:SpoIIE family protein phosphatase [Calditrichota bacterium]RQW08139.1 MAG: GAF domain-containing protein [Calditrichota bacterium]